MYSEKEEVTQKKIEVRDKDHISTRLDAQTNQKTNNTFENEN